MAQQLPLTNGPADGGDSRSVGSRRRRAPDLGCPLDASLPLVDYGHLFHDRLDEVADAMTAARDAEPALHARSGVASVLPRPPKPENGEEALPSASAGQGPFRVNSPRNDEHLARTKSDVTLAKEARRDF